MSKQAIIVAFKAGSNKQETCWITDAYPHEQLFLEYFFEWVSSGLSFILYVGILLRVRGNLIHSKSGWHLRFVPRHERWQLAINRDWLDSSMLTVAARLLWYPISYIILLLPISFSRLYAFGGDEVPFGVTIVADTLFDLQGFVNVILLYATHRLIPDPTVLPNAAPRKAIDLKSSEAKGITPFTLLLSSEPESAELQAPEANRRLTTVPKEVVSASYVPTMTSRMSLNQRDADRLSVESFDSVDSHTPLSFSAV
ncbi:hypothetical protein EIP86_011611 [Pleurotus ostreatoroseus]|nr:hypothetical protein EIP86_011611 [Pleurotus ostreatoroseus]